ncbi:hypothetical protein HMPREF1212_04479 [Parabacteroides sp. HGS0025]|jgi:hypothetical protein|uniref:hypothetical protein n=1 Tax=Parabacteroides sp. HGS0025 TaxID=1078087 RepID=UPI0006178A6C|nr:hypothetical protein [Parabacteroides sp. HGS0025]KKB46982.1 hypothetical protein HMPREF1212_04479 [Parabacteroides sp. HGS0025]
MPHPEISVLHNIAPDIAQETYLKVQEYLANKDIAIIRMQFRFPSRERSWKMKLQKDTGLFQNVSGQEK